MQKGSKFEKAEKAVRQTLQACENTIGIESPSTIQCVLELATCIRRTGRKADSLVLFGRAREDGLKFLGPDHTHQTDVGEPALLQVTILFAAQFVTRNNNL
jgi:hypothetical protein